METLKRSAEKTMGWIHVNENEFPLIVVTFEGAVNDDEFEGYLARLDTQWARKTRSAIVLDATRAARTPATQRKRQAEWMKKNDEHLRTYSAGSAFVINSPLVRGGLTAILWLQALPSPFIVVATLPEAKHWARAQLQLTAQRRLALRAQLSRPFESGFRPPACPMRGAG